MRTFLDVMNSDIGRETGSPVSQLAYPADPRSLELAEANRKGKDPRRDPHSLFLRS